jgi:hypothetical protein
MLRLPATATAIVLAGLVAYWLAGLAGAHRKLEALEPLQAKGHYTITLAFAPERFHQVRLQDKGRLVEVRDRTVYMMDVAPRALRDIAREYWVESVSAWSGR